MRQSTTNQRKLIKSFRLLQPGWNGYGAPTIPREAISRALRLLKSSPVSPSDIYPTGRGSIQFEYDMPGRSAEVEIWPDKFVLLEDHDDVMIERLAMSIREVLDGLASFTGWG